MKLPTTDGLTSQPLIFVVDDRVYAGHYHSNGWFYNDIRRGDDLFMARSPKAQPGISGRDYPIVTEWYFLNAE